MSEMLFDFDPRTGPNATHVLMPNMAYACGGSILTKSGWFTVGITTWAAVTCLDCQSVGEDVLRAEMHAMQGRQEAVA